MEKNSLGEIFVEGRIINLDSTKIEDIETYLKDVQKSKKEQKDRLNSLLEQIYN